MRDIALQAAGVIAIIVALAHGVIGEVRVFANTHIDRTRTRTLLRMVWQATTIDRIAIGTLLIVAPGLHSDTARAWINTVSVVVYGYAAVGNAMANRRLHAGWMAMGLAVALALFGA